MRKEKVIEIARKINKAIRDNYKKHQGLNYERLEERIIEILENE